MGYLKVSAPAGVTLPPGATSVSIPISVAAMIDDGTPDPSFSGPVHVGSMNPDFCAVAPLTVFVPPGQNRAVATPLIPQLINGQWVCDLMFSADADNYPSGGSAICRIYGVPPPPQPTTRRVTITHNGVAKSSDIPLDFTIDVEGVGTVYNSKGYVNPIEPPGGGWNNW